MYRFDIVNHLIARHQYTRYLEIGVRFKHDCFDRIRCPSKISVDPNKDLGPYDFTMTSDEFFAQNTRAFDIVFIDGWHSAEQVFKDINNSLACLAENGTIVLHDCSPPDERHTSYSLCGTVWKAIYWMRLHRPDLVVQTVDTDYGVGVIRRGVGEPIADFNRFFNYELMSSRRRESLGLISVAEFQKLYALR